VSLDRKTLRYIDDNTLYTHVIKEFNERVGWVIEETAQDLAEKYQLEHYVYSYWMDDIVGFHRKIPYYLEGADRESEKRKTELNWEPVIVGYVVSICFITGTYLMFNLGDLNEFSVIVCSALSCALMIALFYVSPDWFRRKIK